MSSEYGRGSRVLIKIPFRNALPKKTSIGLSLPTPPSDVSSNPLAMAGRRSQQSAHPGPIEITTTPVSTASTDQTPGSETSSTITSFASFGDTGSPASTRYPFPEIVVRRHKFHVLIAEDNPLNSRLLETRLTKRGHTVKVTVDGQMCADTFKQSPTAYDLILMDLQVCESIIITSHVAPSKRQPISPSANILS
jgi:hypothetical protein